MNMQQKDPLVNSEVLSSTQTYMHLALTLNNEEEEYENEAAFKFANIGSIENSSCRLIEGDEIVKHLWVYPGLNLRGRCSNGMCPGRDGVWCSFGYGVMDIGQKRAKCYCRVCKQKVITSSVRSLGFTRAIVELEGEKEIDDIEIPFRETYEEKEGKFIYFDGALDETQVTWSYLKVTCKQI